MVDGLGEEFLEDVRGRELVFERLEGEGFEGGEEEFVREAIDGFRWDTEGGRQTSCRRRRQGDVGDGRTESGEGWGEEG